MNKSKKIKLGSFEVESGKLIVSDPCYQPGTWCMGELRNVRNGIWLAEALIADCDFWGERVSKLTVRHAEYPNRKNLSRRKADFKVAVDSAQAGFFDAAHYSDSSVLTHTPSESWSNGENAWYDYCCELTLSERMGGVLPYGAVSRTGYGDGCYECCYYANDDSEIVLAEIRFITRKHI